MRLLQVLCHFVACLLFSAAANAFDCSELEPRGGADMSTEFKGKIDGKIDGLFAKLAKAGVSVDGLYKNVQTETLKNYPNADNLYLIERLIYLKCISLSASGLSDADKQKFIGEFTIQILKHRNSKNEDQKEKKYRSDIQELERILPTSVAFFLYDQKKVKRDGSAFLSVNNTPNASGEYSLLNAESKTKCTIDVTIATKYHSMSGESGVNYVPENKINKVTYEIRIDLADVREITNYKTMLLIRHPFNSLPHTFIGVFAMPLGPRAASIYIVSKSESINVLANGVASGANLRNSSYVQEAISLIAISAKRAERATEALSSASEYCGKHS